MTYKRKEARPDLAHLFWRNVWRGSACWIWVGTVNNHGYGVISADRGQNKIAAHRYSYWLHFGNTDGVVCHRCDNPRCVNPSHLFLGTQAENMADMTRKGRRAHCGLKGEDHPKAKLTNADTTYIASLLKVGERAAQIAADFGVDRSTVYRAARRANV